MSGGWTCRNPKHRDHWVVVQRECNFSAFSGYRYTPSAYSAVKCTAPDCGRVWRTRAGYVAQLPDAVQANARQRLSAVDTRASTGPGGS